MVQARVDSGTEHPRKIARCVYSDQFLSGLKERFGFDALEPNIAAELRDIAFRYIVFRREGYAESRKSSRREYLDLLKATEHFITLLKPYEERGIASDMQLVAPPQPNSKMFSGNLSRPTDQPQYADETHYGELLRGLQLLKATANWHAHFLASRGGRPKNLGLQELTRKAAELWITQLHRRFTVDYHRGSGLSTAFEFVQALVAPLDDVTDPQIITAMRALIASRRAPRLTRRSKLPRSRSSQ